jgi:hypothetical protein
MNALNYGRLNAISSIEKNHYRGDKTRFPIEDRRSNTKCFYVREENGERVFDITYGNYYETHKITKEEHDSLEASGYRLDLLRTYTPSATNTLAEKEYLRYEVKPRILGVVRPDNTFEFTRDKYYQGERGIMSQWCIGYFNNDSRRGGMLYVQGNKTMHPIWKGMRVDCTTMKPTQEYQVFTRQINRKAGKALTASYKDFIKTNETMFKAMDWQTFIGMAVDVRNQYGPETPHGRWYGNVSYANLAESIKDKAPMDAAVLFMLKMDIGQLHWHVHRVAKGDKYHQDTQPIALFEEMKRKLNKMLYRANKDVFKRVEQPAGQWYPCGDWGVEVIVDGKEVKQYGYGV